MRRIVQGLSLVVLLFVGGALAAWQRLVSYLESPGVSGAVEKVVVVPAGAGPAALMALLEREALVARPAWFRAYLEHFARPLRLTPGEYALSAAMAPVEILRKLEAGKVVVHAVELSPGATAADVVKRLAALGLGDEGALAAAVEDRKLVDALGLAGETLEGYLFPDAYELPRGLSPRALLESVVAHYRRMVGAGIVDAARARGLTEHELITLASLIEKSDALPTERKTYSAMLHNRLREGLPLESDASVDYGVQRLHLDPAPGVGAAEARGPDHPWNTRRRAGLPPGPIASPGLAAIVAAAEPAVSGALYWVKRKDGSHVFCPDAECFASAMKEHQPGAKIEAPLREKKAR